MSVVDLEARAADAQLRRLGEAVTVAGAARVAIFEAEYLDAQGVAGAAPVLFTRSAEAAAVGATIVARSLSYTVAAVEPDGHGMTLHRLRRA